LSVAATAAATATTSVDLWRGGGSGRDGHTYNSMPPASQPASRPARPARTLTAVDGHRPRSRTDRPTDGRESTRAEQMKNGLVPR